MTTFDPRSQAWTGLSPDEIVRRVRCEADDAPDEGDSPAQIWREACDMILLRMGKHPSQSPTPDGVIKERGEDEEAERALRDGLSQVEPASGLNPSDFDPSRICPNPALYDTGNCCGGACSNGEHDGYLVDLGYPARVDARIVEFMNDPDAGLTHEQIATEIGDLAKGGTNITGTVLGALNRAYQRGLEYPSRKPTVLAEDVFQKLEAYRKSRVRFGATSDEATSARVEVYNLAERCRYALDCARDQRAEREDAQRPRPEAASPVRAAEAPASLSQVNPPPEDAVSQPRREDASPALIQVAREAERILTTVKRSGCLPDCMMPDGAEPCKAFQEQDEAIRAALALLQKPHPDPTTGGEAPGKDEGWQPIETAPTDTPYTADMPDEAEGAGMGWAISDDDDRLLFLVWWEIEAAGRWTVTKWHPLPSAPRPSQREG